MRLSRCLLLLGVLAAVPRAARADSDTYREWINHCTTGSFRACFSVQVLFVHRSIDLGGGATQEVTDVEVIVANRQGVAGLPDSGPWDMGSFALSGLSATSGGIPGGSGLADVTPLGGAGPAVPGRPAFRPEYFGSFTGDFMYAFFSNPPGYAPIWGCDVDPVLGDTFGGWQTCNSALRLNFTLNGTWTFTDHTTAMINFRDCGVVGECTAQVTPEPVTLILLGTGLMGTYGVLGRRRRKEQDG